MFRGKRKDIDPRKHYHVEVRDNHEDLGEREFTQLWNGYALRALMLYPEHRARIVSWKEARPS